MFYVMAVLTLGISQMPLNSAVNDMLCILPQFEKKKNYRDNRRHLNRPVDAMLGVSINSLGRDNSVVAEESCLL